MLPCPTTLSSLISEIFKDRDAPVFVRTAGNIYGGKVARWDDRGVVLDSGTTVIVIPHQSIIAVSDKRTALDSGAIG